MKLGTQIEIVAMPTPKCAKCSADMVEGFLPDETRGPREIAIWVAGKPELGLLGSVKIDGREAHRVRAFRCTKCGYLELYAVGSP